MGEMMFRTSRMPQEMTGSDSSENQSDHHKKAKAMEKDCDPFDMTEKM